VSVAIEILINTGLWSKFQNSGTLGLAKAVRVTNAGEIMIGMQCFLLQILQILTKV